MNQAEWNHDRYLATGQQGSVTVPGGVLSYRLAGPENAGLAVVIENGWSGTYPYAVWLEQALAQRVRVLSYDRAGVGASQSTAPLTSAALSRQLAALLSSLGVNQPLIVVGHSYGGLIAALHAAQLAERVRAIIQIDPTPELHHELTDPPMRSLPTVARVMQLCALLGINRPLFLDAPKELPPEIFQRIKSSRLWLVKSLNGAIDEIRLLEDIRSAISASPAAQSVPRLVISGAHQETSSWLQRVILNEEKARKYWEAVYGLHQRQTSLNGASRWLSLPYNHISLVTNRQSAGEVASAILDFVHASGREET